MDYTPILYDHYQRSSGRRGWFRAAIADIKASRGTLPIKSSLMSAPTRLEGNTGLRRAPPPWVTRSPVLSVEGVRRPKKRPQGQRVQTRERPCDGKSRNVNVSQCNKAGVRKWGASSRLGPSLLTGVYSPQSAGPFLRLLGPIAPCPFHHAHGWIIRPQAHDRTRGYSSPWLTLEPFFLLGPLAALTRKSQSGGVRRAVKGRLCHKCCIRFPSPERLKLHQLTCSTKGTPIAS